MSERDRLTRIETILEGMAKSLDKMEQHIDDLDTNHDLDKADLAKLKNQGAGILIGVSIAAGTIGAFFDRVTDKIFGG